MDYLITLKRIPKSEKVQFMIMAEDYFNELDPQFSPSSYWITNYFPRLLSNPDLFLKWIFIETLIVGFVLYGTSKHLYKEKQIGTIYDFYVEPSYRRKGIAKNAASLVIKEIEEMNVGKIQLEIMLDNESAVHFWSQLGFFHITGKYVLSERISI